MLKNIKITKSKYYFVEVCSGCGGLSSGFINKGFTPLLLNEVNKTCCKTLEYNHPNTKIRCESMTDVDYSQYKNIDLFMGGVPCQSFSQAGKRKGLEDKRGNLILEFGKIVDNIEPKIFLIENVKGLLTHNKGETIKTVIKLLNKNNKYKIKYKVLNSNDYGIAQKRHRVIIVGVHKNIKHEFQFPIEQEYKPVLKDVLKNVPKSEGIKYCEYKKKIMEQVPPGGCWVNLPVEVQKEYMKKSYFSGGGKRGIARRLSMDEPCLTLTTSPCQKQTERCHPTEVRPFNIREYARIQSFPDDYKFIGSVGQIYKQIGNAVPVKLAEVLAESIKNILFLANLDI